jgi:signal transduction histidine kinase
LPLRGTRDELDRLSATINSFLDRIATYLEQNREFTANAAHELRSPLAAIQSTLEVSLNNDRTIDEYKELLLEILEECESLGVLVNQLLILAESDAGHLQLGTEPMRLDEVVRKAIDMFRGVAEAAEVDLRMDRLDAVRIEGDAGRMRQVINNLIDNAIKFTPAGGRVDVSLTVNATAGQAVLSVADTGVGIPESDLAHLFNRFYRGDKSRHRGKEFRGTGLGLSICESIVAAHGGQISVASIPNRGTTMSVTLPIFRRRDAHLLVSAERSMDELSHAVPHAS